MQPPPQWLADLTHPWGIALVFLNVLVEQVGLPVPAVPILLVVGAVAPAHLGWAIEVCVLAVLACVLTDVAWFAAGRRYGNRLMQLLCRISLSPDSCVSETHRHFARWGAKALVIAKFIPGLTVIAIPLAGAQRMPWARFIGLSALGSVLWIAVPVLIGVIAAPQIAALLFVLGIIGGRAVVLVLLLLTGYLLFKWWRRRRFYAQLRMARVEPAELHAMLQREPPPIVLDVRSAGAHALDPRSIPTALHVPPEEVQARLPSLAYHSEVIVYCTCPNEASAARVAKLLMQHGVGRVRPLRGGLEAWVTAGYVVTAAVPSGATAG